MKGKKLLIIEIIIVTIIWYLFLYSRTQGIVGACVCPPVTEDTYMGPNWPSLLPETGCGDCGLPESPTQFFQQLFLISLPAILILVGYVIYSGIKKIRNKSK